MHALLLGISLFVVLSSFSSIIFAQQSPTDMVSIVSHSSFVDQAEYFHVVGEVQNNSTSAVNFVQVIGTYYDANDEVVGTAFTFTQPENLPLGGTAPFDLILTSASVPMSEIDHYSLKLTWREAENNTETSSEEVTTGTVGTPKSQQKITCGSNVTGTVTLSENLSCTTDGLIVAAEATTINLNGFTILGPGADSSKVGIGVSEDSVTINGPGVISGFQAGVIATAAKDLVIRSLILQDNQIAAFLTGADRASIQENIMKTNNIGVASHTAGGLNIENNLMNGNGLAGVTFVNTDESTISDNNINGSQNAIFLDAQSAINTIQMNDARDNAVDINNANGLAPTVNQNVYSNNRCQTSNPSGLCSNAP